MMQQLSKMAGETGKGGERKMKEIRMCRRQLQDLGRSKRKVALEIKNRRGN